MQTHTTRLRGDPADMLGRLGQHWGLAVFFGTVTLALGVLALAWPGRTLIVVAVVFGVQLVVMGIWRFVAAFATSHLGSGSRVLYALLGVLSLVIGLYALRHVLITIVALALLLGIFWVVNGTTELFTALSERGMPNRGWLILLGHPQHHRRPHPAGLPGHLDTRARGGDRHLADRLRLDADLDGLPDALPRPPLLRIPISDSMDAASMLS